MSHPPSATITPRVLTSLPHPTTHTAHSDAHSEDAYPRPFLVLALTALDLNHGGSHGPANSGVTPYAVKPTGLPALLRASLDRVVISVRTRVGCVYIFMCLGAAGWTYSGVEVQHPRRKTHATPNERTLIHSQDFELMTNFVRPFLTSNPTIDTNNAASTVSVTESPVDPVAEAPVNLSSTNNMVVAEALLGPAATNDMVAAEDPMESAPTTDMMVAEAPMDPAPTDDLLVLEVPVEVTFTTSTVIVEDAVDAAPAINMVVTEAPEDVTPANDSPSDPTFDCENGTTSDVIRSYLLMLCGTICVVYASVRFVKTFTKQTFYDALERFSAAPDSPSTLQRATRTLSFWGKNSSDNDDKDTEEKVDWSYGLLQITFLCSLPEMSNFSFSVVASSPDICLKIAEAIVLHLIKPPVRLNGHEWQPIRPCSAPDGP